MRKINPITPHRSGWCLKLPLAEHNQAEHNKCPRTFPAGDCLCSCGHKGERTLESRGMVPRPYVAPKTIKIKEEDTEVE
jgi:hypothetical protein